MKRNDGKDLRKEKTVILRWMRRVILAAAVLVISVLPGSGVSAVVPIDFTRNGNSSIQIILETLTGAEPVESAEFTLYQLQKLDQQNGFVWNPEYMACDIEIDGLSSSELADAAAGIADYSEAHHITGIQQTTDGNGCTTFTGLELGMYLIVWNSGPLEIEAARPFLVSVPMEDPNGWVYDLIVRPKVDEKRQEPDEPHVPEESNDPEPGEITSLEEMPVEEELVTEISVEEPSTEYMSESEDDTDEKEKKLPQTGPQRWINLLLVLVGLVFCGTGLYIRKKGIVRNPYVWKTTITAAVICMVFSAGSIGYYDRQEIIAAKETEDILLEYQDKYSEESQKQDMSAGVQGILINGELYGGILYIPALTVALPVDMELSGDNLKKTPCIYKGDVRTDTMIIAAHNYAGHFGSISQLEEGDEVIYVDSQGQEYRYGVSECEIIDAYDVAGMEEGDWDLTLFTCTYGGRARVAVRCNRIAGSGMEES